MENTATKTYLEKGLITNANNNGRFLAFIFDLTLLSLKHYKLDVVFEEGIFLMAVVPTVHLVNQ